MHLDIPTLVFAATPVFAGLAAILTAIWRLDRRDTFLLALVAANVGFLVACAVVVLAMVLPPVVTAVVTHTASAFGFIMLWRAARLLVGRPPLVPVEALLVGLAGGSVALTLALTDGFAARAILHSLFAATGCGLALRELRRMPSANRTGAITVFGGCLGATLAFFVLRALASPFVTGATSFLDAGVFHASTILFVIFASTMAALAAVSISFSRVRHALEIESRKLRDANEALRRQARTAADVAAHAGEQRRKAEDSERFIAQLVDTVPVPLFHWGLDLKIRLANDRYAALYGLTREAVVGKSPDDLLPPHLARRLRAELENLIAGGEFLSDEADLPVPGRGVRRLVAYRSLLRDDRGEPVGITGALVDVTEQAALRSELEHLASSDPLTGLANRRSFVEIAERAVEEASRRGECLSLMMLDVDGFKRINDTFGHAMGDQVLVHLGETMHEVLGGPGELAARIGGEEFVVLAPGSAAPAAAALAERLRRAVAESGAGVPGGPRRITASIGVATLRFDGDDALERLLERADAALYQAKRTGRNRVVVEAEPACIRFPAVATR